MTPEHPGGTYAYFTTLDAAGNGLYPYVLGPQYYGVLISGNTGPGGGHVTPGEPVVTYLPTVSVGGGASGAGVALGRLAASPNPSLGRMRLSWALGVAARVRVSLYDVRGAEVMRPVDDVESAAGDYMFVLDPGRLPAGAYFAEVRTPQARTTKRLVLIR